MSIGPLTTSIGWTQGLLDLREQMVDLQRQFGTGKKAETYGELGGDRTISLAMRARISEVDAYSSTIQTVQLRTQAMTLVFDRGLELLDQSRSDAATQSFEVVENGQTAMQQRAAISLEEMLSLLSTEVAGRHLFAGREVDSDPVAGLSAIMDGEGGKAGFRQHLDERRQADLGADGLGRLAVPAPVAGDVTIAEDAAGSPFGFKISAATSTLSGTTVSGPAGSPASATISFGATLPEPGENIRIELSMPDGTATSVVLTAVAAGEGGAPNSFEIGADAAATAANFQAALAQSIERAATTELAAASGFAAAQDFFAIDGANPPQRVDGPPFDSATALRDATATDTVRWYTGDDDSAVSARSTSVAKVDDQVNVAYGARANEEAFTWLVQNLAVLAAETFDDTSEADRVRYSEMSERAMANFSYPDGRQKIDAIYAQIATVQYVGEQADTRHTTTKTMAENLVAEVEVADRNEVAVSLLSLQTRLEASYQVTAILAQMNLTNFL